MALHPGDRLDDRYTVLAPISRGGFAEVYRIRHDTLGSEHAVKLLRADRRDARQRLLREGRLQARLRHPNLVQVTDTVQHDDAIGLVMELVEGSDLADVLRSGPPPLARALKIGAGILAGVNAAHQAGLIHRDLKPANILMTAHGEPRVSDFGLVRVLNEDRGERLTGAHVAMGTPGYMAPEQYVDAASADERADIFALGCVLAELLIGTPLFSGNNYAALRRAALNRLHRPLPPTVPVHLVRLIDQMLDPDPQRRPPSADAVLQRWTAAPPPTPEEPRSIKTLIPMSEHPSLDALLDADPASSVAAHLAECPACRAELKMFRAFEASSSTPLPEPPHNLPAARDAFVGRRDALAAVEQALHGPTRLITLLGFGGIGKSRLMVEVGRRSRAPGGAWWVPLAAARSTEAMLHATAAALGLGPVLHNTDPHAQIGAALDARGDALLLLDNFEQLPEDAAALVAGWMDAAPQLRTIVTSRIPLAIRGEHQIVLSPLDEDDALALFEDRARTARARFAIDDDPEAAAQLTRRLDGLPLAIELAAARARLLPPRKMLKRLDDVLSFLKSRAPDRPERHRTLRAALEWSWDLLDAPAQDGLARLSVFAGGFSVEAAEEAGIAPLEIVEDLLERSLLTVDDEDRLDMLQMVQAFAQEKLPAAARRDVERRHGAHFAEMGVRDEVVSLGTLRRERDNLDAAFRRALAAGDAAIAARCALALGRMVMAFGPAEAGIAAIRAVQPLSADLDPTLQVDLLWREGELLRFLNAPGADTRAQAALALARQHGDRRGESWALYSLGARAKEHGRFAEATALLQKAIQLSRDLNETVDLTDFLQRHAINLQDRDRDEEAVVLLNEALALSRSLGDELREGRSLADLGRSRINQMRTTEAEALFIEARARLKDGDEAEQAMIDSYLADLQIMRGEVAAGLMRYEAAYRYMTQTGDRFQAGRMLSNIGIIRADAGDLDGAKRDYIEAIRLSVLAGDRQCEANTRDNLGNILRQMGDLEASMAQQQTALGLRAELGLLSGQAVSAINLARSHRLLGAFDAAEAHLRQGLSVVEQMPASGRAVFLEGVTLRELGTLSEKRGASVEARALIERSAERLRAVDAIAELGVTLCALARMGSDEALAEAEAIVDALDGPEADALRENIADVRNTRGL
ncbi:MAG: protein kinase [Myxococcota bacterium]